MATFSGSFTKTVDSGATWYLTVDYLVTPSVDLTNYSVTLTFKAKRSGWGTSYNETNTSYITYAVIDKSIKVNIPSFSIIGVDAEGGGEVVLNTSTIDVPASSIDFSNGIAINVYWYTGILSNQYIPEAMSVNGVISVPEEYAGLVYISNGTTLEGYMVYVSDGVNWNRHIPYVSDGTSWNLAT